LELWQEKMREAAAKMLTERRLPFPFRGIFGALSPKRIVELFEEDFFRFCRARGNEHFLSGRLSPTGQNRQFVSIFSDRRYA
jgi:hypothetical protein